MTRRTDSLTAGIVGTGFMGVAHTEALRRLGVNVKAIVGSTPERARSKAATSNLPPVVDSVDQLLADPTIDVVHITTPNHLHHEQVSAVIDAGKHVLCEKPLAVSVDEGLDLERRALAAGVLHAVCFNQRYYPLVHQAREMVAAGDLGRVRLVSGGYLQDWLLFDTDWNWRLVAEKGGELRAVADIGSHWFDNVEFDSGARGVATISQVSAGRKNFLNWEIDCAQTAISWNTENPENLWIGHRGEPNQILKRDASMMYPAAAATTGYPSGHVEGYPDTFKALFADFYAHVASGGEGVAKYPTFAAGVRSLRVCDAVAESARTNAWASVTA